MPDKDLSNKLEGILNEILPEMPDYADGDLLVEWVLVAYVTNPDKEEESAYPMLFSNGEMPSYRARGLLGTALVHLNDLSE